MSARWSAPSIVAFFCLAAPAVGLAQTRVTGQIVGTVKDPSGAVVAKADLLLVDNGTGAKAETESGADGGFVFPPGTGIAKMTDKEYWDRRARGLGGNPTTCAEENLLGYPGTRYYGENILVHEFSHAIMGVIRTLEPPLYEAIQAAYKSAMAKGLYKRHYAATNANEYWAEGTQWWFWSNYEWRDGDTRLQTPEDLKAYDAALFELLSRAYSDHRIPMDVYHGRNIKPSRRDAR